jgi:neutral ceramidase
VAFRLAKYLLYTLAFLLALAAALVKPIDRTPMAEQSFYQESLQALDTFRITKRNGSELRVGWGKVNITPAAEMPMAGYRPRPAFKHVHDSLFIRVLVVSNSNATVALVSADLLLFPPALLNAITERLTPGELDFVYPGATHTHNGIGGWDDTFAGQLIAGNYNEQWVNATADAVVVCIRKATRVMKTASFAYAEANGAAFVVNRLRQAPVDDRLRIMTITRSDSTKACFFTFSAHANCINKKSLDLSADYPGEVVNQLQKRGFDFAMYIAGMVGSHRPHYARQPDAKDFEFIQLMAADVADSIATANRKKNNLSTLAFASLPIRFGPSQMRLEKNIALRTWVFNAGLGELSGELKLLRIGGLALVGTPCDFSGELYLRYFNDRTEPLIITSFNGGYVGYITEDSAYDIVNKAEVRNMNWVGPYHGQYFSEMIGRLVAK